MANPKMRGRRLAAGLFLGLCVAIGGAQAQTPSETARRLAWRPPETVLFVNANVRDPAREEALRNVSVAVADGRITSIGTSDRVPSTEQTVVDLEGRYFLVPGLIDAHNHVYTLDNMYRSLVSGVTTFRTVGVFGFTDVVLRDLVRSKRIVGPEIFASGVLVEPIIPVDTWHPGEAGTLLKDPRLAKFVNEEVRSLGDIRELVTINLDHGVDVIKVQATENAGQVDEDPRRQIYTEEQIRTIVEMAEQRGVHVAAHAHGDEGMRAAVRAGVRSIEHGTYASDETLKLMAERGVYLTPTLAVGRDLGEIGGDYDDVQLRIRARHVAHFLRKNAARARAAGVKIVTGSDVTHDEWSLVRLSQELWELVEIGFTPREALAAATLNGAELLGIEERTGRIAEGFEADLLIVAGDPIEDIVHMQEPILVMTDGRIVLNRLPFAAGR